MTGDMGLELRAVVGKLYGDCYGLTIMSGREDVENENVEVTKGLSPIF